MQDREILNDLLGGTKASINCYTTAIVECSNQQLRSTFQTLRNEAEQMQYQLYQMAEQKGYYMPAPQAQQNDVQKIKSGLSSSSNNMNMSSSTQNSNMSNSTSNIYSGSTNNNTIPSMTNTSNQNMTNTTNKGMTNATNQSMTNSTNQNMTNSTNGSSGNTTNKLNSKNRH